MLETMVNRRDELNEKDDKIARMLREEDIPVAEHFLRVARRMSAKARKAKRDKKKNYYEAGGAK